MAEGRCADCLLYEQRRGDRIRAEIARTSPRRRERIARWSRYMEGVHARHLADPAERTLGRFEDLVTRVDEPPTAPEISA